MHEKKKNVPQLRFPGFSGDWEERKSDEIFYSVSDKNHPELTVLSASQEFGMVRRDEIGINIKYDKKSTQTYKRVIPGQFVIHLRSFQGGFAYANIEGITSPAYTILDFKEKEKHNPFFWREVLTSKNFIKRLESVTYGIRDGRSISFSDFSTLKFRVPSYDEQKVIGAYLVKYDHLITLHQRKITHLQARKKGLLQKMFPKDGEPVPEWRFPGFTDAWEQHKLGELGTVQTCKRIFKEETSENGEIPFYKNGTLGLKPDSYISRERYEEFKRLYTYPDVGDILISVVGSIGRTAEYTGKDEYFQDSNVVWLKTDDHINKKFLKTSYQVINWIIEGSTVKHLYNDNILRSEIMCPKSQIEQQKIGDFFQNFENIITLHQRKLEHLQARKKALLQQMFV